MTSAPHATPAVCSNLLPERQATPQPVCASRGVEAFSQAAPAAICECGAFGFVPFSCGRVSTFDPADLPIVAAHKWRIVRSPNHKGYALCSIKIDGVRRGIVMHRLLTNAAKGSFVDHIDGDGLCNIRRNLRVCSHSQNMANRRKKAGKATSDYLGVFKSGKKWRVEVKKNGFRHRGSANTEKEAALIYNELAMRLHGEFARLNVVLP